jgi:DNA invertase Pin-like site-specific DNA recombinase
MAGDKSGAAKTILPKDEERWESITTTLATILSKFDDQGARLTTLSDNYGTLKSDQGRLHAAVNNVQSKQLQLAAAA